MLPIKAIEGAETVPMLNKPDELNVVWASKTFVPSQYKITREFAATKIPEPEVVFTRSVKAPEVELSIYQTVDTLGVIIFIFPVKIPVNFKILYPASVLVKVISVAPATFLTNCVYEKMVD